jgi:hypothetical protein
MNIFDALKNWIKKLVSLAKWLLSLFLQQADIDGARLVQDIIKNISRPVAFDTVMRVRTSTGVRPTEFYGHFFMSNTTDMEIAAIGKQALYKNKKIKHLKQ